MDDISQMINDAINKCLELNERRKIQELKEQGIIVDAVLLCNPKHKKELSDVLYKMGIKKIPIVWEKYVEDDKIYMITDKDLVDNIKDAIHFEV